MIEIREDFMRGLVDKADEATPGSPDCLNVFCSRPPMLSKATGQEKLDFPAFRTPIQGLYSFSPPEDIKLLYYLCWVPEMPDHRLFAVGDGVVVQQGNERLTLVPRVRKAGTDWMGVSHVSWSPDGKYLAMTCNNIDTVEVAEFTGSALVPKVRVSGDDWDQADCVDWNPDGKHLAIASNMAGAVEVAEFTGSSLVRKARIALGASGWADCVSWNPDGRHLAIAWGNLTNAVEVVEFTGSELVRKAYVSGSDWSGVICVAWNPDGRHLAIASNARDAVEIAEFTGGGLVRKVRISDAAWNSVSWVAWNPDGKHIAIVTNLGVIEIAEFTGTALTQKTRISLGLNHNFTHVSWSPDGRYVAMAIDYTVQVAEFTGFELVWRVYSLSFYKDWPGVYCVKWHPDGRHLAVACWANHIVGVMLLANAVWAGLSQTNPVSFETCVNYLVGCDGVSKPWKWDGATDPSELLNAPPDAKMFILHKEKLFCVRSSEPSTVYFSDSFQPESWPEVNYLDFGKGDGTVITAWIKSLEDTLLVFKNYSYYELIGTSLEDFRIHRRAGIGCVGPRAITDDGTGVIYFISYGGIYRLYQGLLDNLTDNVIPNLWERVNQRALSGACATFWHGLGWFCVPVDGSEHNNLLLIYDPATQAWWPWSRELTCFVQHFDGVNEILCAGGIGRRQGYVLRQDVGYSDCGEPVESYWVSRRYGEGDRHKYRYVHAVDSFGLDDAEVAAAIDEEPEKLFVLFGFPGLAWDLLSDASPPNPDPLARRYRFGLLGNKGRYLRLKLTHKGTQNFGVRKLVVEEKPRGLK